MRLICVGNPSKLSVPQVKYMNVVQGGYVEGLLFAQDTDRIEFALNSRGTFTVDSQARMTIRTFSKQ